MIALLSLALLAQLSAPPGVLVERRLAEGVPLRVGDTVSLRSVSAEGAPQTFVVEGIFERAADPSRIARNEMEIRLHLPDLESLLGIHDRVDRFAVALTPGTSPDSAARWIESLAFGTRAYGSDALAEETGATFRVVSRFHRAIGIVTLLASGIFLLCVMIIRVDERRRDVGMLRLIGISRGTVFRTIVTETVGIALLGSALGALLGVLGAQGVNLFYAQYYDTTLRFALVTPRIVATAGLLGLVLGIAAGGLAAWRIVRVPPQRLGER